MTKVEKYHDWGCGALNNTADCMCGTVVRRPNGLKPVLKRSPIANTPKSRRQTTLRQALERQKQISKTLKGGDNYE